MELAGGKWVERDKEKRRRNIEEIDLERHFKTRDRPNLFLEVIARV